jgi:hypothetical protein
LAVAGGVACRRAETDSPSSRASPAPDRRTPSPALEGLAAAEAEQRASRGRELYQSLRCFSCHEGVAGHALTGLTRRYTLSSMIRYLEAPTPPMPTFRVTDEERRDLAVHLLTEPSMW